MDTRTGKIARLPHEIRQELNQRLRDGLEAATILPWLNSLPEVQSVLADQFAGLPVNESNLSAWRKGGFQDWLRRREAQDFISELDEADPPDPYADENFESVLQSDLHKLMRWLTIQYAAVAAELSSIEDPLERWTRLRQFCSDLVRLRGADLHAESTRIDSERLEIANSREAEREKRSRLAGIMPGLFAAMAGSPSKLSPKPEHAPPAKTDPPPPPGQSGSDEKRAGGEEAHAA